MLGFSCCYFVIGYRKKVTKTYCRKLLRLSTAALHPHVFENGNSRRNVVMFHGYISRSVMNSTFA